MSTPSLKKALSQQLQKILAAEGASLPEAEIAASFEAPPDEKFGDYSTNLILKLAKSLKKPPRPLAETVCRQLQGALAGRLEKTTVEGPGFVNFYRTRQELTSVLSQIRRETKDFGKPHLSAEGGSASGGKPKRILLEFVSANPTGPLTVAHGRQAALGDSLARILRYCGHQVTAEYYNNDEGVQIETLGKSLALRVQEIEQNKKVEMPEDFYRGEYLIDVAREFVRQKKSDPRDFARTFILESIRKDLKDFDVSFDNYYSQEALGKSGKVEKTLEELKKKGVVFEQEGAVWFRSTQWKDDKDRVLIKSDKTYTYLTPDIAYHHDKFARGFDELVNIWGPDHHGYIPRLKASQAALGHDAEKVHILIAQLVTLFEGGQEVRMSTRAGQFVTLRQILDEVGKDAGRFFFVMRKFDAHLDFDLALAKTQTPENPAFYIQYAHARIESIKNKAKEEGLEADLKQLERLGNPAELRVLRLLSQFEDALLGAERTLEPYRLVPYLMELASSFHKFYADNRVVSDDKELSRARLALIDGVQQVIRTGLNLLGVSAPTKM